MKAIITFLFFPIIVTAQLPIDSETKKFTYTEVVELNESKNELYLRARSFFVKEYSNADAVIQMDDKDAGRIMGKGFFEVVWVMNQPRKIYHTITIDVKENKYRYTFTDFRMFFSSAYNIMPLEEPVSGLRGSGLPKLYSRTDEKMKILIHRLKDHMTKPVSNTDW
jgi:hypothetical protein